MSNEDELELQALQRELDDAFATTRPRRGFEDELWLRVQASRPATSRLRDAIAGLVQGVREVPAVPAAAVATLLVVLLGAGLLVSLGPRGGGGGASTASNYLGEQQAPGRGADMTTAAFGRLPSPAFDGGTTTTTVPTTAASGSEYLGPVQYVWSGKLEAGASFARVYRYREPSTIDADQFASSLGAVLRDRQQGLLGSYSASTYTLNIVPTTTAPIAGPTFFIISSPSMPPIEAAGAGPGDVATIFLSQHSLVPNWGFNVAVDASADPTRVVYQRQFEVEQGLTPAYLVDGTGERFGLEVDLKGSRPTLVKGMLPVSMDTADYRIVPAGAAAQVLTGARPIDTPSPPPVAQLTQAELVYVLVPAGDHGFYEPAYLFTGTLKVGDKMYTKRVLVAAVDPSQRTSP